MAQAVFNDHPIEQYLRESGEVPELMPGGTIEFSREPSSHDAPIFPQSLSRIVRAVLNVLLYLSQVTGLQGHSAPLEFAEKFKYIVISSPLLSSSISSSLSTRAATPTIPGHFESGACQVSLPLSFPSSRGEESWLMTLETLEALVAANDAWNSVVSDALRSLENEERDSILSVSPLSHSLPLRIALSSSLHTTQSQCDNVRQLLSALTSPLLLPQLSEMYAPPSPPPMHTSFPPQSTCIRSTSLTPCALHRSTSYPHVRVTDDSQIRIRTSSASPTSSVDKRSTWNGSYMSLSGLAPRRHRHRSNVSTIIRQEHFMPPTHQNVKGSISGPPTPTQSLIESPPTEEDLAHEAEAEEEPFGVTALDLHRTRRTSRPLMFEGSSLSPGSSHMALSSVRGSPLSTSFGSRFTTLSTAASPSRRGLVSLSNLRLALHSALAAKRFACAHLLALRFSRHDDAESADSEDKSYWEDVRSVIALLTSTLEDASARLSEALTDAMHSTEEEESSVPVSPDRPLPLPPAQQSFAPVPSLLSRFAVHVEAISAALDDAREDIRASVTFLRGEDAHTALESYERLRREIGLALRECERGRGILLEIVRGDSAREGEGEGGGEDASATGHDEQHFSSDESDKTMFNVDEKHEAETKDGHNAPHESEARRHDDDASMHLLMTATSQHLPPPGIEQVFESLSLAPQPFIRERSSLTRQERISLVKARRGNASAAPSEGTQPRKDVERWGPGGEVVQELKDVIWKVGEQRRKMVERSPTPRLAPG